MIKESLKENINMKEESLGNNSEIDTMKKNDVMQIKNAFELMFESAKGGKLKPITPKRKKSKMKVASIGTPKSTIKGSTVAGWLRKMSK